MSQKKQGRVCVFCDWSLMVSHDWQWSPFIKISKKCDSLSSESSRMDTREDYEIVRITKDIHCPNTLESGGCVDDVHKNHPPVGILCLPINNLKLLSKPTDKPHQLPASMFMPTVNPLLRVRLGWHSTPLILLSKCCISQACVRVQPMCFISAVFRTTQR